MEPNRTLPMGESVVVQQQRPLRCEVYCTILTLIEIMLVTYLIAGQGGSTEVNVITRGSDTVEPATAVPAALTAASAAAGSAAVQMVQVLPTRTVSPWRSHSSTPPVFPGFYSPTFRAVAPMRPPAAFLPTPLAAVALTEAKVAMHSLVTAAQRHKFSLKDASQLLKPTLSVDVCFQTTRLQTPRHHVHPNAIDVCNLAALTVGCVVYVADFDIQHQFARAVAILTPCDVHIFDCLDRPNKKTPTLPPRVHLHKVCISGSTKIDRHGNRLGTIAAIAADLGHQRIDLLRIGEFSRASLDFMFRRT